MSSSQPHSEVVSNIGAGTALPFESPFTQHRKRENIDAHHIEPLSSHIKLNDSDIDPVGDIPCVNESPTNIVSILVPAVTHAVNASRHPTAKDSNMDEMVRHVELECRFGFFQQKNGSTKAFERSHQIETAHHIPMQSTHKQWLLSQYPRGNIQFQQGVSKEMFQHFIQVLRKESLSDAIIQNTTDYIFRNGARITLDNMTNIMYSDEKKKNKKNTFDFYCPEQSVDLRIALSIETRKLDTPVHQIPNQNAHIRKKERMSWVLSHRFDHIRWDLTTVHSLQGNPMNTSDVRMRHHSTITYEIELEIMWDSFGHEQNVALAHTQACCLSDIKTGCRQLVEASEWITSTLDERKQIHTQGC